ncbi:MAG: 4Fe-4S dicluster domain-containing protein [Melioribacteraceae bacterium]|nr:4Fe-4S dicluster domain-containing protein [Melioribacteraceae bacterium]
MNRRTFLKTTAAISGAITLKDLKAKDTENKKEFFGVLVDTTKCIGCRSCEVACAESHGLEVPDILNDSGHDEIRSTNEKQYTVVNKYDTDKGEVFVKKQCMHCWQPACASACLTNAMYKTIEGPIIWREDKCMGCRFCMVSCPFDIPKFEYNDWNPKIQKCDMCWNRLQEGKKPACVSVCPTDAITFGMKRELMEIARNRVYGHPDKYVHQIYGEHEVGGTGWLYLSAVPFDQIGFRTDLGTTPYPEFTKDFLYNVPVALFGIPALLLGLNLLTERYNDNKKNKDWEND